MLGVFIYSLISQLYAMIKEINEHVWGSTTKIFYFRRILGSNIEKFIKQNGDQFRVFITTLL